MRSNDIAVLPEIWTTGYSLGRIEEEAETIDGSTIAAVRKIANDHHCAVVAGSIPLRHKEYPVVQISGNTAMSLLAAASCSKSSPCTIFPGVFFSAISIWINATFIFFPPAISPVHLTCAPAFFLFAL